MFRKLFILLLTPVFACCETKSPMNVDQKAPAEKPKVPEGAEVITLASGCFWCAEAAYRQLPGVYSAVSGYMGGHVENPTYEQVCDATTGHAECVQVVFDPKKITATKLLEWFWNLHDPTTLNRQGNDVGPQYRSAIFYSTDAQKTEAEASKKEAQANFEAKIVTEITKATTFYPAENYHQNYYEQNKSKNPYCQAIITPKLKKLKLEH
jgi:peptide-methionine (S)-S-oxide reductase